MESMAKSVLGTPLVSCSTEPLTGWRRDGFCRCDETDRGEHSVCAQMTESFLKFSLERGNDLVTPKPEYGFSGLRPGDYWCLCATRWVEAFEHGVIAPLRLESCHESFLKRMPLETLLQHQDQSHVGEA